nr:insulin-degrading enzyme-like 1, peroxisomal [Tanacetum cinerariifolium]
MASRPRLRVLAASKNKLSTLKGFPSLPSLEKDEALLGARDAMLKIRFHMRHMGDAMQAARSNVSTPGRDHGHRRCLLQKHLSAEDHPYHKFSTGNWDTLEVKPKARGIDTRSELLKFYKENYSANLMNLVVYSKGWATSLSAGESDWTVDFSFFKVAIDLSDAGHENIEHIIGLLFKYISLLQQSGVCKWIFDELAAICEMTFHYQDKIPPMDYVVKLSSNMQLYPAKDWLVGSSLPSNFSPEITGSIIQEWMKKTPEEQLHLPSPNVFIPTDLSIKNVIEKVNIPVMLRKSEYSRLYYKPDTSFSTPKAYVKLDFYCPFGGSSPEANVLTDISTRLLMDYLNEYACDAQVAGLYYAISHTDHGFQVHQDDFKLNIKLQLVALIAKQPAFHQLRSVEQLGYITVLMQRNDSGIRGVQFIIQSTVKGPKHIESRVQAFLKTFESKLYEMPDAEFKHKNLREESGYYWREIQDGTLKFDRKEYEVEALKQLTKAGLIQFYDEHIKADEYSQEVLDFSDTISSGNPTSFYDPIVSTTSSTLTPFRNSDFLLEEVDAFLAVEDEPTSSEFYQPYLDPEGDILLLESFLNDDPSPPPYQGNYMPKICQELKICEAHFEKSSVDEPHVAELKELPPHLEYAFLEGDDKLLVIIAKDLSVEEKTALITILKSHKRAIT